MEDNIVVLENNKDYNIVDSIVYNNSTYLFLCNEKNIKDIVIRKLENGDKLSRLTEEEFDILMNLFLDKKK